MNIRFRKAFVVFALAIALLLAITSAHAASANDRKRIDLGVQACVAEIAKRADYRDASRVLHVVVLAKRDNRVELKMSVETMVYSGQGDLVLGQYSTSCVTGALGKLVKFELHQAVPHV